MGKTLLFTGHPQSGKTTVIRKIIAGLGAQAGGFFTEEIFGPGGRQGFELFTLEGQRALLAHKDLRGNNLPRIGRYGVNLNTLEDIGIPALLKAAAAGKVVIVDEIGKMELLSPRFRDTVLQLILGPAVIIGAIIYKPQPQADLFKKLAQVTLWEVNQRNRDQLPQMALEWLAKQYKL
ncbi:MAG: AAA family ATPase [Anaerolineae bacterium]|nr:AAA family ATPase [Anaerolineae bacterium]